MDLDDLRHVVGDLVEVPVDGAVVLKHLQLETEELEGDEALIQVY